MTQIRGVSVAGVAGYTSGGCNLDAGCWMTTPFDALRQCTASAVDAGNSGAWTVHTVHTRLKGSLYPTGVAEDRISHLFPSPATGR